VKARGMNTRRAVLCSLCSLAGTGWLGLATRAHSEEQLISCTDSYPKKENLVPVARGDMNNNSSLLTSTGEPALDRAIKAAILDCYQAYVLKPAFYFVINDPLHENNAFARPILPGKPTPFGDVAGEVGFGVPYLQKSLLDDPNGDETMRIIAHEFGHILQYNLFDIQGIRLYNLLRPDGANIKLVELHADFISGVYLAGRYLRNPRDMSRLNYTITGDNEVHSQYHHGTTAERRRAFRDGFRSRLFLTNPSNNPIFDLAFSAVPYIKSQFSP
jgi:hypothetical protein